MLNWKTYDALPRIGSYAEALAHFNKVTPIRGDANGTKPVGRRDQKWLSIYVRDTDKAVCVGNMWSKERPLLAYYPDGRVSIEQRISASCRERIQKITGLNIQRFNNEDWVSATAFVDGKEVTGRYPLGLRYNDSRTATFILRDNANHIYLNPMPVFKHIIDRKEKAKLTKQYKPFMDYVEVMAKLSADDTQDRYYNGDARANPRMPQLDFEGRKALGIPHNTIRYSTNSHMEFLSLVDSDDTEQWYKAMIWLSDGYWVLRLSDAKRGLTDIIYRQNRDALFIKVRAEAGVMTRDRYARYFR